MTDPSIVLVELTRTVSMIAIRRQDDIYAYFKEFAFLKKQNGVKVVLLDFPELQESVFSMGRRKSC